MGPLLRTRTHLWPTAWGWTAVATLAAALLAGLLRGLFPFLAINAPASHAVRPTVRLLVVEGWSDREALRQAATLASGKRYVATVTSGGPIAVWPARSTYAEYAAQTLHEFGLAQVEPVPCEAVTTDRTYASAVAVRDWVRARGIALEAIDIFSPSVHARRSRATYRMVFGPSVEVGALALAPTDYDPRHWWTSSQGVKTVLMEAIAWVWVECCFWPGTPPP